MASGVCPTESLQRLELREAAAALAGVVEQLLVDIDGLLVPALPLVNTAEAGQRVLLADPAPDSAAPGADPTRATTGGWPHGRARPARPPSRSPDRRPFGLTPPSRHCL